MFKYNKKYSCITREQLLSQTELVFYGILRQIIQEDIVICPKVGLNEIFIENSKEKKENYKYLNKISMKPIDFLLCSSNNLKPILVIDLEDGYYNRKNRIERDRLLNKLFNEANLPLLRFERKKSYKLHEIKEKLDLILIESERSIDSVAATLETDSLTAINKNKHQRRRNKYGKLLCPVCGAAMMLKKVKRGSNKGKQFYTCSNYPECKETVLKKRSKSSVLG